MIEEEHDHLSRIPTQWSLVFAAHGDDRAAALGALVARYGSSIERYIAALVKRYDLAPTDDVVAELCQQFYFKLTRGDLRNARPTEEKGQGRFRYYVKATLRNLVRDYVQNVRRAQQNAASLPGDFELSDDSPSDEIDDQVFVDGWQRVMLDEVWQKLELNHPKLHAVLWMAMQEEMDSGAIAEKLGEQPDWVRQNKKRAREKFGELLLLDAAQTLDSPTAARLRDELGQLGLSGYYDDGALQKALRTLSKRR